MVGLLGTRWSMDGPVYAGVFGSYGIATKTPSDTDPGVDTAEWRCLEAGNWHGCSAVSRSLIGADAPVRG
jgi:aspartate/glutamate racemase